MQFEVTREYKQVQKFFVPDNATDEEYDEMKRIVLLGMDAQKVTPTTTVKRIDVTEPQQPYEINKDCD
jgi:hypothetical protein